ncbi:AcrR family transcriptional regulator [Altererythrobacter atlanticus]|uniref:Uncharacterized protein n=1 Tax=Croceibacterium atlanticum TaxID=1267766 RepID=A0A0F7KV15_9SPHN|nr:TetR/AcrR family transcriptional regulator C-terminal domain-containing protein [Croceibacterium atlanticum]AKH42605.1 hypothetical protein WYH_01566 [Croceibacterium atlanticum]MBB5731382.1 AcrR family transcriptional regulator [Croceibacterium atlanticum]
MNATQTTIRSNAKQRAANERCDAMLQHARDQIMAVGVDRFSLNEVLRQSGGSKATLVKYFGDRNGLIAAAIGFEAQHAVEELALETANALPLQEALERFLGGILRFYLLPGSIALYRAVVSAADSRASAGFYRNGHQVIVQALADLLDARKGRDVHPAINSAEVADQMLHAIRAGKYERALIGLSPDMPDAAEIKARAHSTAALFVPALGQTGKA